MGVLLGLFGGVVAAVVKMVQGRAAAPEPAAAPASSWTPIPGTTPMPEPVAAAEPIAAPVIEDAPPAPPRPPVEPSVLSSLQESPAPAGPPTKPDNVAPKKTGPAKRAPAKKKPKPWVDPVGGECPGTHPVKAKLSSKIFHLPGGINYARTQPDRCYIDAAAAEADGLRPAKR